MFTPKARVLGIVGEHGDFPVESISLSFDRTCLVSASHDRTVRFWNVNDLCNGDLLEIHRSRCTSLYFLYMWFLLNSSFFFLRMQFLDTWVSLIDTSFCFLSPPFLFVNHVVVFETFCFHVCISNDQVQNSGKSGEDDTSEEEDKSNGNNRRNDSDDAESDEEPRDHLHFPEQPTRFSTCSNSFFDDL